MHAGQTGLDERIKPALLDRLSDDEPGERSEGPRLRFATARELRDSVVRDLAWLLNSVRLSSVQDLAAYPLAARSVLNFGLPDLSGRTLTSVDVPELEAQLKQAIIDFEPRLLPDSLHVSVHDFADTSNIHGPNSLQFSIEAKLIAHPLPLSMWLRTDIDLETGDVSVAEWDGERG
jgi:type VI secretion system protein ImpF